MNPKGRRCQPCGRMFTNRDELNQHDATTHTIHDWVAADEHRWAERLDLTRDAVGTTDEEANHE